MTYTAEYIKQEVETNEESLFSSYAAGRSETWSCDKRTKELVCIAAWLQDELVKIGASDADRRTQLWKFNRESRSDHDLYECAAAIMNEAVAGDVEQNRIGHRRWG